MENSNAFSSQINGEKTRQFGAQKLFFTQYEQTKILSTILY
jgi:hypothetical protein